MAFKSRIEFIIINVSAVLIISAFSHLLWVFFMDTSPRKNDTLKNNVVIGVVSSRDHFENRKAIRHSWGKLINQASNVNLYFFVGISCPYHPLNRIDTYSCSKYPSSIITSEKHPWKTCDCLPEVEKNSKSINHQCIRGFGFKVFRPLVLSAYLINTNFLKRYNTSIIFRDAEEEFDSRFISPESCDCEISLWCRVPLKRPLELPVHFEGEIQIAVPENFYKSAPINNLKNCTWTTDKGLHYTFTLKENVEPFSDSSCSLISLEFAVKEPGPVTDLSDLMKSRDLEWKASNRIIDKQLEEEHNENNDMVFFPYFDVYRNLPLKVLYLIKWSNLHYAGSSILKVDDDTFLNTSRFLSWFSTLPNTNPSIWAEFHHHRSVPLFGKWADYDYHSNVYPPFPSGSAYLLSGSLVRLLAEASPYLRLFQGEDISIGLWTELLCGRGGSLLFPSENQILEPQRCWVEKNQVPCWLKSSDCQESFFVPQCSINDMLDLSKT